MNENLLINLQRILIIIRYNIKCFYNIEAIDIILQALEKNLSSDDMVKKINSTIWFSNNQEKIGNINFINTHSNIEYSKREQEIIKVFLNYSLIEIKKLLKQKLYNQAFDLVDSIHVFPEMFFGNTKRDLKKYWEIYLKPFQTKWQNFCFDDVKYLFK